MGNRQFRCGFISNTFMVAVEWRLLHYPSVALSLAETFIVAESFLCRSTARDTTLVHSTPSSISYKHSLSSCAITSCSSFWSLATAWYPSTKAYPMFHKFNSNVYPAYKTGRITRNYAYPGNYGRIEPIIPNLFDLKISAIPFTSLPTSSQDPLVVFSAIPFPIVFFFCMVPHPSPFFLILGSSESAEPWTGYKCSVHSVDIVRAKIDER